MKKCYALVDLTDGKPEVIETFLLNSAGVQAAGLAFGLLWANTGVGHIQIWQVDDRGVYIVIAAMCFGGFEVSPLET